VLEIPSDIKVKEGWPDRELLIKLGGEILDDGPTRVVKINGKTYSEGLMEGEIQLARDAISKARNLGDESLAPEILRKMKGQNN